MSTSRRELLTMGAGAGVAALTLPSFLSIPTGGGGIVFAQGRGRGADPLGQELTAQFRAVWNGLTANPPRGNAQRISTLYRMLGAWGRANNIDATIKQGIEDAIAARGHHEVVTSLRAFDRAAFAKRNGIPVSPHSFGNPTYEQVAKGIGMVRAGASLEKFLRFQGAHIGRNAERFNRRLAILNNQRNNDAVIRLVQDDPCDNPDPFFCYDETPDPSDCKQNPDGSFNCVLIGPTVVPDPPKLEPDPFSPEWTCGYGGQSWGAMFELGMAFLMLVFPEIAALFMLGVFAWEWWQAANGC